MTAYPGQWDYPVRLEQCKDANTAAWPRCLQSLPLCLSLMHIMWGYVGGFWWGGQLGVEAEWSQGMLGKHPASVLHPGQQESKQSITCRGRCPPVTAPHRLVGVFCHYGQQHCDVVWLSSWTERREAQTVRMVLVKI